jgi:hypothetical protein
MPNRRNDLKRVQEVIKILDLADRAQSAHRHADGLAQDRRLADARISDATAVFPGALEALVHVPSLLTSSLKAITRGSRCRIESKPH